MVSLLGSAQHVITRDMFQLVTVVVISCSLRLQCQHAVWLSSSLVQGSTSVQSFPVVLLFMQPSELWSWRSLEASHPCRARLAGTCDVSWGIWASQAVRGLEHQRVLPHDHPNGRARRDTSGLRSQTRKRLSNRLPWLHHCDASAETRWWHQVWALISIFVVSFSFGELCNLPLSRSNTLTTRLPLGLGVGH